MRTFRTSTRVRYAETDAAGIVYYNNYFIYFELGRIELFRELGLPYDWRLPIVETYCRFHSSAKFDDEIEIESFVGELRTKGFRIDCRVSRKAPETGDLTLLADGHTSMVTVGEDRKPIELPGAFKEAFENAMNY